MKKYSPGTYARDMQRLEELRNLTTKQAEEIKALRLVVDAHNGLFFRGKDQHPDAVKKLTSAQQNLSRFHARHGQPREELRFYRQIRDEIQNETAA